MTASHRLPSPGSVGARVLQEAPTVPGHLLVEPPGRHPVELGQIGVQHHFLATDHIDLAGDTLYGIRDSVLSMVSVCPDHPAPSIPAWQCQAQRLSFSARVHGTRKEGVRNSAAISGTRERHPENSPRLPGPGNATRKTHPRLPGPGNATRKTHPRLPRPVDTTRKTHPRLPEPGNTTRKTQRPFPGPGNTTRKTQRPFPGPGRGPQNIRFDHLSS